MLQGYARLTFQFERDGSDWIGTCVELGTSTFGRYRSRVQRDLTQLVTEYINVLEEDGTRERIFRENNITVEEAPAPEPVYREVHTLPIGVPA